VVTKLLPMPSAMIAPTMMMSRPVPLPVRLLRWLFSADFVPVPISRSAVVAGERHPFTPYPDNNR
jgi:hypothetical protein